MKVVLFCGGQGTRLREYSQEVPKPLAPVGGMPIMWHIMKYYASFGHTDFILCLGYKGEAIKRFFLEYNEAVTNDFVIENQDVTVSRAASDVNDWRITLVDTGQATNIGGRLLKVRKYLEGEKMFFANYTDILTDLDLNDMAGRFRRSGAIAGFCSIWPPYSFHLVHENGEGRVTRMTSVNDAGLRMNGGYLILTPEIFDNLYEGEELVVEGFARLIEQDRLYAHAHDGFWMPMDTFKEKQALDEMWAKGDTPWQLWST